MAVYGNLLTAFPELYRRIDVWTAEDQSDKRSIVGVFLPTKGDKLKGWKFSNRGTASDYSDDDQLFVNNTYLDKIHVGDYFYEPDDHTIHRVMGELDFNHPGGFKAFTTEHVTGATVDHTGKLEVKSARF